MMIMIIILQQRCCINAKLLESDAGSLCAESLTHYARRHMPDDLQLLLGQSSNSQF